MANVMVDCTFCKRPHLCEIPPTFDIRRVRELQSICPHCDVTSQFLTQFNQVAFTRDAIRVLREQTDAKFPPWFTERLEMFLSQFDRKASHHLKRVQEMEAPPAPLRVVKEFIGGDFSA